MQQSKLFPDKQMQWNNQAGNKENASGNSVKVEKRSHGNRRQNLTYLHASCRASLETRGHFSHSR